MKKAISLFSAITLMIAILISIPSFGQMKMETAKAIPPIINAALLKTNMRKLWEDHVLWTRNVILCIVDELPGTTQAVNRLLNTVFEGANKRWHANADEISAFLSKANPDWALADMKMMMDDHLKMTTDEVVCHVKKEYDADVIAYDKVHTEILKISNVDQKTVERI